MPALVDKAIRLGVADIYRKRNFSVFEKYPEPPSF
jgi:hypothetical protein